MARPNPRFEFVNRPVQHRTERISSKEWEKWKPIITKLYLEITLAEVVTRMQEEHGFIASERQYGYQLNQKWGVKKQCSGTASAALPSSTQLSPAGPDCQATLKRRRHCASIRSSSSTESALSKPPRKRVEQDGGPTNNIESVISLEDTESGQDWTQNDSAEAVLASPSTTTSASYLYEESPGTTPDSHHVPTPRRSSVSPKLDSGPGVPLPIGHVMASLPNTPTEAEPLNVGDLDWLLPVVSFPSEEGEHSMLDGPRPLNIPTSSMGTEARVARTELDGSNPRVYERAFHSMVEPRIEPLNTSPVVPNNASLPISQLSGGHAVSPPVATRVLREIDCDRPIETFSSQDIADIKLAAEYMSVFDCNREAFELYTTLLKRQLSDDARRDNTFWHLIIQCAHTASIPEHIVVIQNIIRAELEMLWKSQSTREASYGSTPPYFYQLHGGAATTALLLHMLLAFTSNRNNSEDDEAHNITKALALFNQEGKFPGLKLPPDDRSLDLAVYRNILRLESSHVSCDFTLFVGFDFSPSDHRLKSRLPFEEEILFRESGPFELQTDGRLGNPCIRSCVSWCQKSLSRLPWMRRSNESPRANFRGDKAGVAWADANQLFVTLWGIWMTYNLPAEWTWMTATQDKMGISATELLLFVCRAIQRFDHHPLDIRPKLEVSLLKQFRIKAKALSQLPDLQLARAVLMEYVRHNTIIQWPSWRSEMQQLEKSRMLLIFENVLLVRFPRLVLTRKDPTPSMKGTAEEDSVLNSLRGEEEEQTFPVVAKAQYLSPTLASSLSSVDLSLFKKTRTSAMLRLSNLVRGPSSAGSFRSSALGSNISVVEGADDNISVLTQSFQSMSISIPSDSVSSRRASLKTISTYTASGGN